jgi:UDP-N-acetylmuramate: L-alanyl-gamma-D-glutamyl-meso-diaminopimelate ligase
MLAWILEHAGLQPGFLVGGVPLNFSVSARLGNMARPGTAFVIEADEYDTAFFDKRSKFVHYRPRTAILNNLEYDHADIFDDLAAIERQFHHLVRIIPSTGRIVVNGLEESLQRVLHQGCWSEVRTFGAAVSDFRAEGEPTRFDVLEQGHRAAQVHWDVSGVHNQLNALAAIAAAQHVGVTPAKSAAALREFRNVKRAWKSAASPTGSPSTTTSRTTRRRSAPPSTACGARSASNASWRCSSPAATR